MSRSTDQLPPPVDSRPESGRVSLEEVCNIGKVLSRGTPLGFRTQAMGGVLRGVAWSDEELVVRFKTSGIDFIISINFCLFFQVFECESESIRFFGVSQMTGVRDVTWVDGDSYMVTFPVRRPLSPSSAIWLIIILPFFRSRSNFTNSRPWRAAMTKEKTVLP